MSNSTLHYNPITGDFERKEIIQNPMKSNFQFDEIEIEGSFNDVKAIFLQRGFNENFSGKLQGKFDSFDLSVVAINCERGTRNVNSLSIRIDTPQEDIQWKALKEKYDRKYGTSIRNELPKEGAILLQVEYQYNTTKGTVRIRKTKRENLSPRKCIIEIFYNIRKEDIHHNSPLNDLIPENTKDKSNYMWVKMGGKYFLLNTSSKEIIDNIGPYDEVEEEKEWVKVKKDDKIGILLLQDTVIATQCEYKIISKENNLFFAKKSMSTSRKDVFDESLNKIVEDVDDIEHIDTDIYTIKFSKEKYLICKKEGLMLCLCNIGLMGIKGLVTYTKVPGYAVNVQNITAIRPSIYKITSVDGSNYILFSNSKTAFRQNNDNILFLDETYQCYSENHLIGLMKDGQKISEAKYSAITFPKASFIFAFTPYGGLNGNAFNSCEIIDLRKVDSKSGYFIVYHGLTDLSIQEKNNKGCFNLIPIKENVLDVKDMIFSGYYDSDVDESIYAVIGCPTEDTRAVDKVQFINYDYMKSLNLISN